MRIKRLAVSIFLALSLVVSSFAAPLCACLNVTARAHDCCEKMKDHCPMKSRQGDRLDKLWHSGCGCFAEKRETPPTKISDNGNSRQAVPVSIPNILPAVFAVRTETEPAFFIQRTFTENPFLSQLSARAPPRL